MYVQWLDWCIIQMCRINTKPMPSAGGLSIVIAFRLVTRLLFHADIHRLFLYIAGRSGWIVSFPHRLDRDVKELSAKKKMIGIRVYFWQIFGWSFGVPSHPFHFEPWLSYSFDAIWLFLSPTIWLMDRWTGGLLFLVRTMGISVLSFSTIFDHDDLCLGCVHRSFSFPHLLSCYSH